MKYTNDQIRRIKNAEYELQGEFQKAVWSIIKRDGEQRLKVIALKLGRGSDQTHTIIGRLIDLNLVKKTKKGCYDVSDYIMEGKND